MMRAAADELIPTRESLLSRLKNWDDDESWRDFFDTYWRLIYVVAVKAGLTDAEAQDVVQETVAEVAKKMRAFKYDPARGSFKGWLLKLTQWRVTDQFRRRPAGIEQPRTATDGKTPLDEVPDPAAAALLEGIWDEEWQKNLMDRAVETVKTKVSPRQYQMFQLYALEGWPVKKTAAAFGVSRTQIYVAKHQVSRLLKKEINRLKSKGF
ncbi:MAG TPA: sigma-70 family RNA polymerase sigma factor [Verrucomicrobiae bacterium]